MVKYPFVIHPKSCYSQYMEKNERDMKVEKIFVRQVQI